MLRPSCLAGFALVAVISGVTHAQTCEGNTSFSVARTHAAGDVTLGGQMRVYGASVSMGQSDPAFFGGASITGSRFAGETMRRTVAAFAGYSRPLKGMDGLEACAVADYAHGWLFGGREDVFSMGVGIGRTIAASATMDVVPFGGLRLHSSNRGTLAVGAGVVFAKSVTVRPTVQFPVAHETSSNAFGISVGYALERR